MHANLSNPYYVNAKRAQHIDAREQREARAAVYYARKSKPAPGARILPALPSR